MVFPGFPDGLNGIEVRWERVAPHFCGEFLEPETPNEALEALARGLVGMDALPSEELQVLQRQPKLNDF